MGIKSGGWERELGRGDEAKRKGKWEREEGPVPTSQNPRSAIAIAQHFLQQLYV